MRALLKNAIRKAVSASERILPGALRRRAKRKLFAEKTADVKNTYNTAVPTSPQVRGWWDC